MTSTSCAAAVRSALAAADAPLTLRSLREAVGGAWPRYEVHARLTHMAASGKIAIFNAGVLMPVKRYAPTETLNVDLRGGVPFAARPQDGRRSSGLASPWDALLLAQDDA